MNQEIKKLWLDALRSGKYEQGRRCLRDGEKYCCLGVLADIVDPSGWHKHGGNSYEYHMHTAYPPLGLLDSVSLPFSYVEELADMNDTGSSFLWIAKYIEDNL